MLKSMEDWLTLEECQCGGPVFKYHNLSKNHFIVKCGYLRKSFDQKTKKYTLSKKQPCKYKDCFVGEPVSYDTLIYSKPKTSTLTVSQRNSKLEERLIDLFNYYQLAEKSSTLQEIDIIVRTCLGRKMRYIYYSPTTTLFMTEVLKESIEDYRKRIFSKPIIDRRYSIRNSVVKNKPPKITELSKLLSDLENLTIETELEEPDEDNNSQQSEIESSVSEETEETEEDNSSVPDEFENEDDFIEDDLDNYSDQEYSD